MPAVRLVLQVLCCRRRTVGIRHCDSCPNGVQDLPFRCCTAKAVRIHDCKQPFLLLILHRCVTHHLAVVYYAPRWCSVRSNFRTKRTRLLTDCKSQRYFIVVVRSQNDSPSVLYLRGGAIGCSPYLEYCYLGCTSPLLHVPWNLRLLGCALNVISFLFVFGGLDPG